jgi:ribonuclease VapC
VNVFDASALLVFLRGEEGASAIEEALAARGACGAANWAEVAQKIRAHDRNWDLSRSLLASYGLVIEPVTAADAEWAARRWTRGEGLSLADRLCLALGERLDAEVWTADQAWGTGGRIRQIR